MPTSRLNLTPGHADTAAANLETAAHNIGSFGSFGSVLELQTKVNTKVRNHLITEKASTRVFAWLKAAFTLKNLLRHYAKQALTPW